MSNVYVHFSQISFPARYSIVNFQLVSRSLRFREVILIILLTILSYTAPQKEPIAGAKSNIYTAKSKNAQKKPRGFRNRKPPGYEHDIPFYLLGIGNNIFNVNFPFACAVVQVPLYVSAAFCILEIPKPCRNLSAFVV